MVKRKIAADTIGLFGIVLGLLSGMAVIDAELYMNPMDYHDNNYKLAIPFYEVFCLTSITFILIRRSLLHKKYILVLLYLFFIYSIGIITFIALDLEKIPDIIFWAIYGVFPLALFDMMKSIFRAKKITPEKPPK